MRSWKGEEVRGWFGTVDFVLLLTWEAGFFSLWLKVLRILRFVGIRMLRFVQISLGTRED